MGRPIEIASPASTCATVDHTVVSVGPYIFHSARTRGSNASASSRERASPPQSSIREGLPSHPSESNMRLVAGVAGGGGAPRAGGGAGGARAAREGARRAGAGRAPAGGGGGGAGAAGAGDRGV